MRDRLDVGVRDRVLGHRSDERAAISALGEVAFDPGKQAGRKRPRDELGDRIVVEALHRVLEGSKALLANR